ncbi:MAG: histidine kinase dimerization/phosphoacceptor domain -containing protein [Balneolales bacterium]
MVDLKYLRIIFKASPTPQLVVLPNDPQFTIVEVNEAYLQATHTRESDLINKSLFDAFPENTTVPNGARGVDSLKASLKWIVTNIKPHSMDILRYDIPVRGTSKFDVKYWEPRNQPVLDEQGKLVYIIYSPIDVTKNMLAEQKIEAAKKELRKETHRREYVQHELEKERNLAESLINSLPGTFYLFDAQGHMHRWNYNLENLTGYTTDEIKQMVALDFIGKDHVDFARGKIEEGFVKGQTEATATLLTKGGRTIPFLFHATSISLNNNPFMIGIGLNISEHAKIEEQLKSSVKEKEVLLNEVHHRVKNNLAIISSLLKMQANKLENQFIKDILGESEGRIQAMAVIHELLYQQEDFSRIDFSIYIHKLVQRIKTTYQDRAESINTDVQTAPVYLEITTAVPCALIINELLTNAYKHAFEGLDGGNIFIWLNISNDNCTLMFSDNGIGLPPDVESGSLGLTLIHGLVKQINGTIKITREPGTTFTITFPFVGL